MQADQKAETEATAYRAPARDSAHRKPFPMRRLALDPPPPTFSPRAPQPLLFPAVHRVHPLDLIMTSDSSQPRGHPSPLGVFFLPLLLFPRAPSQSQSLQSEVSAALKHPTSLQYPPSVPHRLLCMSFHVSVPGCPSVFPAMSGFLSYFIHPTSHRSAGPLNPGSSVLPCLSFSWQNLYPRKVPPQIPLPMFVPLHPRPRLHFRTPPNVLLCSGSLALCPARPPLTIPPPA